MPSIKKPSCAGQGAANNSSAGLKQIAKMQFRALSKDEQFAARRNLKSLGTLDVVSGCTGSNICIVSAKMVVDIIGQGKLAEPFKCEIVPKKALFANFISEKVLGEETCCFSDMQDLCEESAACSTHGKPCQIPQGNFVAIVGWSCRNLSTLFNGKDFSIWLLRD
jgi:hypothetical protein